MSRSGHWQGFDWRRERMVHRLQHMGIHNPLVLQAMASIPRHVFVEEALRSRAYDETALPIGLAQTISQPYTVAIMTQLLLGTGKTGHEKILEIGTGSGYQTAVLQHIYGNNVYSIERIFELHQLAKLSEALTAEQQQSLPAASALDRLAEKLPEDAWLDRLEASDRQVRMMGLASNATELMTQLSKVPEFAELRTTAPTVRDEGQSRERFSFEFTWRDAASGPAAK